MRRAFLIDYQDTALADRYESLVTRVREAESAVNDSERLSRAVAKSWFRLLSYKDEYEVARLHTDPDFLATVRRDFGKSAKLRFHLAPPFLGSKKDARGRPLKREFGGWILPVFAVLARLKGLRGSPFDIFGYTAERRMERQLISDFDDMVNAELPRLDRENYADLVSRVEAYLELRGYGAVKEQAVNLMHASN